MDKIKDIVSSLIPEEQQADIIAQIDGELTKLVDKTTTGVKKELSSKYKVNFFEEDITKAFNESAYVSKESLKELEKTISDNKAIIDDLTKSRDELNNSNLSLVGKENLFNSQLNLVSNGLRVDRLDLIKPHIKGDVEEDFKTIKENYPELFVDTKAKRKTFREDDGEDKTEMQKYFESKSKVSSSR